MAARFSQRLPHLPGPNRLTALLEARRDTGRPWLDLTVSNPTVVGLPFAPGTLQALAHPRAGRYAPDPRGLPAAREAVAADLAARAGPGTAGDAPTSAAARDRGEPPDPDRILLTASTSEAYAWLFKLLCDPGDEVLVPAPGYPLCEHLAALEGVRAVPYPLTLADRWRLEPAEVIRRVGPRTRAVILIAPHNPTGWLLSRGELEALAAGLAPDVALIGDEVFADFVLAGEPGWAAPTASVADGPAPPLALAAGGGLRFSLGGLSKGAGLPQMKVGWIVTGGEPARVAAAVERLEWIADTYLSVATPQQQAVAGWLAGAGAFRAALRQRLAGNRACLHQVAAAAPGVELLPSAGGWSAVLRLPAVCSDEDDAAALLEHHDLLVQPGYFFDFPPGDFLVVSLLPQPDLFAAGAARLAAYLGERAGAPTRRPGCR